MRITLVSWATAGSVGPCGCAYLGAGRLLCGTHYSALWTAAGGAVRSACRTETARPRRRPTDVTFASRTSVHSLNRCHHARRRIVNGCYVTVVTRIVNSSATSRTSLCSRGGATASGTTWAVPRPGPGQTARWPPYGNSSPAAWFRFAVQLSLTETLVALARPPGLLHPKGIQDPHQGWCRHSCGPPRQGTSRRVPSSRHQTCVTGGRRPVRWSGLDDHGRNVLCVGPGNDDDVRTG